MRLGLPWQVFRQRTPRRFRFSRLGRFCTRTLGRVHRLLGGLRLLQIFQSQLQLFNLPRQFLRLTSKLHAMQLGKQQLQMFNLALPREQLLMRSRQLVLGRE
jgi:hypothetical protein